MGRLTGLPGRIGGLPPRVAPMEKRAEPFYLSEAWRTLRRAKLAEGPAFCCVCGATGRLILDHREERRDGGSDLPALSELDWYCTADHNRKTAKARAERAAGGRRSASRHDG